MLYDKRVLKIFCNVKLKDLYKLDLNKFYMWFDVILETLKLKVEWVYFLSFAFRFQFENMSICCNVVYCFLFVISYEVSL